MPSRNGSPDGSKRNRGQRPGPRVQGRGARRRRDRPRGPPRRDLRLPRSQRRRQVDHGPHAHHPPASHRGFRVGSPGTTSSRDGAAVRDAIGAALQEAALDPNLTAREHMRLQGALHGMSKADRTRRGDELIERVGPLRGRRPQGRRLLGRHEAPARPRARPAARPARALPRRAHHRPRHPEPHRALGRGGPPLPRRGHDRLPHHPVPRGGRPARRPPRDHRPGQDRRRGHARRAQGARSAGRPSRWSRPITPSAIAPSSCCGPSASSSPARRRAPPSGSTDGDEELADIIRAFDHAERQGRQPRAARGEPQRRLPDQDRPLARGGPGRRPPRRARPESSPLSRGRRRERQAVPLGPGPRAGSAIDHAHPASARRDHPRDRLPADPARDQLRRAEVGDLAAGLPDRLLRHLRPRLRLHPGGGVRGDRHRPEPRRGQPGRLLQPAAAHADPPRRAGRGPARRDARARPVPGGDLHRRRACSPAPTSRRASAAPW